MASDQPPAIRALSRDELAELLGNLVSIRAQLETVPHRIALNIERHVSEIEEALGDCLPGGGPSILCEACGVMMGQGEIAAASDEGCSFCADCVARWNEAASEIHAAPEPS